MGHGVGFTLGKKEADRWFEPEGKYGKCFLVPLRVVLCEHCVDFVEGFAWGNLARGAGGASPQVTNISGIAHSTKEPTLG